MTLLKIVSVALLFYWPVFAWAVIEVTDDAGNVLSFNKPVQRIVSLAPHLTEMVYAAGAFDKLVAVVAYSDYPRAATKLPQVGSYVNINTEAVLLHKPDLILAYGSSGLHQLQLQKVKKLGIPVYVNSPATIKSISHTLRDIGRLAGTEAAANRAAAAFDKEYQALSSRNKGIAPVSVFYQVWDKPLMTISDKHFISDAIALCGGKNAFTDLPSLTVSINSESVIRANPQIIIAGGMAKEQVNWLEQWKKWQQIDAVKYKQLYSIPPDVMQRHAPRILQGVSQLCDVIAKASKIYNK